ncbi:TPA: hypothetical protein DEF17_07340, partial [bacterium]|nr:hypothetical protein [bacterium]
ETAISIGKQPEQINRKAANTVLNKFFFIFPPFSFNYTFLKNFVYFIFRCIMRSFKFTTL